MITTVSFSYLGCPGCKNRSDCGNCEARLEEAIMRLQGVNGASVQMPLKQITVDGDLDQSTLTDCMEDLGIFVEES